MSEPRSDPPGPEDRPASAGGADPGGGDPGGGDAGSARHTSAVRRLSASVAGVVIERSDGPDDWPEGPEVDTDEDTGEVPGEDTGQDTDEDTAAGRDWAWVEEWRESDEPPAWAPGLALASFTAVVVGLAVLVLSDGLSDIPWLAVLANVLVASGLAPALWLSRHLPVLRWIAAGAAAGVLVGWIGALIT